jgi:Flp pilus assembly protein TadD
MAKAVGPRKLDPATEPGSQFVVVEKTHSAGGSEALLVAANRALQLGQYDAASGMFDQLYAKNSHDPRILMGRAVTYQKLGRNQVAIEDYNQLLDISPNNQEALVNMLGLVRLQNPESALRQLVELRSKYPDNAGIAAQTGITQADIGQMDQALQSLQIAASLEPQNAQHVFNRAVVLDRMGQTEKAIKAYEDALETDSIYSGGASLPREQIFDRLAVLRQK